MRKSILNIGKALSKAEKRQINGGVECYNCHSYCFANNPFDRDAYGDCFQACVEQYC
jgi:hypothetical protein